MAFVKLIDHEPSDDELVVVPATALPAYKMMSVSRSATPVMT